MSKMFDARHRGPIGGEDRSEAQIYEHLRSKDKNELVDELAVLIEKEGNGEFHLDLVQAYLDVLNEKDPLPTDINPDDALTAYHEKHDLLLEEEAQAIHRKHHVLNSLASKIVAVILMVCICVPVIAQACGIDVLGFIARWSSEIFQFKTEDTVYATIGKYPISEGETATYCTLQDALDAFGVTAPMAPGQVPERLGVPDVTAEYTTEGICISARYVQGEGFLTIRFNASGGTNDRSVEKDTANTVSYNRGGIQHFIVEDRGIEKVNWKNGVFECRMTGNVSEQEMKDIINSIYEGM